jgi:hypothetical protein
LIPDDDLDAGLAAQSAGEDLGGAILQQLLATTVLMGTNRIVVTDGVVKARVRFKVDPDPPPAR